MYRYYVFEDKKIFSGRENDVHANINDDVTVIVIKVDCNEQETGEELLNPSMEQPVV